MCMLVRFCTNSMSREFSLNVLWNGICNCRRKKSREDSTREENKMMRTIPAMERHRRPSTWSVSSMGRRPTCTSYKESAIPRKVTQISQTSSIWELKVTELLADGSSGWVCPATSEKKLDHFYNIILVMIE